MKIGFDAEKDLINRDKHGLSLGDEGRLDWTTVVAKPDTRRDYGERREIGYGLNDGRLDCVVFVRRRGTFRIISLRKAIRSEVCHGAQTQVDPAHDAGRSRHQRWNRP